jgi:hypothetical protein
MNGGLRSAIFFALVTRPSPTMVDDGLQRCIDFVHQMHATRIDVIK